MGGGHKKGGIMAEFVVDMKPVAQHITVQARLKRMEEFGWRVWLGVCLIRLAAWIMWMNVEIVEDG